MKRILVVDDDRDVLDAMYRLLTDHGFHVTPRKRPDEALHDLANEPFDLILSDFEMRPYMNGVEFGLEARALKPIPFVILSGSHRMSLEKFAKIAELECTFLTKGQDSPQDIVQHLSSMIAAHEQATTNGTTQ